MAKYFIVWNADKSEGFITNDEADATSALTGKANLALGYPSQSALGSEFYANYGEEGDCPPVQEVELDVGA